ncbi:hypothetical protein J1G43_13690 [Cellulomonas sp. zg-ZUI22]|uniref:hypothetical protein n=1 Tax=Cellulomonas sp. zg-ZUI22 TaxID=2816955 RepID=UPI001A948EB3|nr:hypothetical protein [Cellulomonas sp. zg-ZUI22]MBO0901015.1 hypothetical protein [Cellulomonas sp. zg-ZUI22]
MSGTAPESSDAPRTPSDAPGGGDEPASRPGRRTGRWWWLGVVAVVVVIVLVWRPWVSDPPAVPVAPSPTAVTTPTPAASPSAAPTVTTPAPVPGADAVFDETTAASLLATSADLESKVPAAVDGVTRRVEPGTVPWGLPEGSRVDPESCTTAVTVVGTAPTHHDATAWGNEEMTFVEDVVVLLDAAAARASFRALVTVVDECPRYALLDADGGRTTWTAEPALEGQGVFPAIVQEITVRTGEDDETRQQTTGHVLVGNAIVTWTATALRAEARDDAQAALGTPAELSAMVEQRALSAVRALP